MPKHQPTPLAREKRILRRHLRQANRAFKTGALDPYTATNLITRLTNTLSRLHLADHHLTTNAPSHAQLHLQTEFDRILISMGLGPDDPL